MRMEPPTWQESMICWKSERMTCFSGEFSPAWTTFSSERLQAFNNMKPIKIRSCFIFEVQSDATRQSKIIEKNQLAKKHFRKIRKCWLNKIRNRLLYLLKF